MKDKLFWYLWVILILILLLIIKSMVNHQVTELPEPKTPKYQMVTPMPDFKPEINKPETVKIETSVEPFETVELDIEEKIILDEQGNVKRIKYIKP